MNEIEKLKFQMNIDNIKHHVRNALLGEQIYYRVGSYDTEQIVCSSCGRSADWPFGDIEHNEICDYIKQEKSREILLEWINNDIRRID